MDSEKKIIIKGNAVPLNADYIDTDQIMPARYMKEVTFEWLAEYVFYDLRFDENGDEKKHPLNDEDYDGASILIAGKNFGCGSSREHAPQGIMRYGFEAIIAVSFAEIFAGNCNALGIPTLTASEEDIETLMRYTKSHPETKYTIDLAKKELNFGVNQISLDMSEDKRQSFIDGTWNVVSMLKANKDKVRATSRSLPYMNNFSKVYS